MMTALKTLLCLATIIAVLFLGSFIAAEPSTISTALPSTATLSKATPFATRGRVRVPTIPQPQPPLATIPRYFDTPCVPYWYLSSGVTCPRVPDYAPRNDMGAPVGYANPPQGAK